MSGDASVCATGVAVAYSIRCLFIGFGVKKCDGPRSWSVNRYRLKTFGLPIKRKVMTV